MSVPWRGSKEGKYYLYQLVIGFIVKMAVHTHTPVPKELPFLEAICYQTDDVRHFTAEEMLNRYERGWKYKGILADLGTEEEEFLHNIAHKFDSWLALDV